MSARRCSPECPEMVKRRKIHEEKLARENHSKNITFETDDEIAVSTLISKSSQVNFSTDLSNLSNETEYKSVPLGDSSSKDAKEHLRRSVDHADRVERSRRKYHEESYRRPPTPGARRVSMDSIESADDDITPRDVSSSPHRSPHQSKKLDQSKKSDRSCKNEECTRRPRRRKSPYIIESSSSDLSCPALCELDETKIAGPEHPCESSCPSQIIDDKRREIAQADVDRFMLYGGWTYFDDLCHCSLKCILIQVFGDKFVQKTATSAIFFAMGMKLCYELDSWFIPF